MFDIRQLIFAIATTDHGSMYRAARLLGVEQSTISRNIIKLERVVGAQLFSRSRSGVQLTAAGVSFIRSARSIVINAERMLANSRAAGQGRVGSIMVGFNSPVSAGNLRASIIAWMRDNDDVDFEVVEADRSSLLGGLNTSELDVAILMGEANHCGFRHEAFWSERLMLALSENHNLAAQEFVHWTDLRNERFALPAADPGPDIRDLLLGRLSISGVQPAIRLHQASRETLLSLLSENGHVSVVCEGSVGIKYPEVVYRPIHGEQGPALTVYSGYWRDDNPNPPLKRFLAFVRNRFALPFDMTAALADNVLAP